MQLQCPEIMPRARSSIQCHHIGVVRTASEEMFGALWPPGDETAQAET